ncbi:Spy/CpxP family protein refolding chaperone [Bradyrhizobium japonicum]|uniref:Spy/CpxP family protein refolding chaperone n=1 Tax=Bradyrhizobium japonicum TaxID=375 RepID=UPI001BA52CB9|nr:Spy/CpxP family protein refolding chaperone [Bradyrhizobium japonicum]MBR0914601.1 Spy/CpxP family protein refolding chaperone [Bradyrhizobium japonicum]
MRALTLAAALLVSAIGHSAWAQSDAEHQGHHPDQKEQQKQPEPKAAQPDKAGSQRMPGAGMMGGGMMDMMGANTPMSDMMRMMGMMRQSGGDGMGGMETIDRVEGRIAFLRTELKITEAQTSAWNAFADALRTNAKTIGAMRGSMMMPQQGTGSPDLVEKLSLQEKWLAARLDGTRAMKSALSNLAGTFSEEQKKTADELLAPHMGMMPMISAMRGGATTGMGMPTGKSPK